MDRNHLPYRPCVGAALFDCRGRVFVARRNDVGRDSWQLPQGGIDKGEDPARAVLRELEEEIGVAAGKVEVLAETAEWLRYDLPEHLLGKVWKGKYRGQEQKWFALRFVGTDEDIDLSGTGHTAEFDAWRWVELDELPGLIVEFKRPVYEALVREFRSVAQALRAGLRPAPAKGQGPLETTG